LPGVSPKTSAIPGHEIAQERAMLGAAAREAGALALAMQKAGVKRLKKHDNSPISEADLAVNALLEKSLLTQRPDYAWLSEESADTAARRSTHRTFIIDPIDGTADFLSGHPRWCIALALLHGADLIASALYNPVTDELFDAGLGLGATCNGKPISVSAATKLENCRMLSHKFFDSPEWPAPWPQMHVTPGGSCGVRMADIAASRADAYLSMTAKWDWDAAPGALLITEAGGVVTDTLGAPFAYNLAIPRQPSIAASTPALHSQILERTRLVQLPVRGERIDDVHLRPDQTSE
jgi:myo-inositol-1(or 4)-monophosphatase